MVFHFSPQYSPRTLLSWQLGISWRVNVSQMLSISFGNWPFHSLVSLQIYAVDCTTDEQNNLPLTLSLQNVICYQQIFKQNCGCRKIFHNRFYKVGAFFKYFKNNSKIFENIPFDKIFHKCFQIFWLNIIKML